MFKKPPYGTKISPACAYCTHGSPAADQKMVLCKNRGVVSPYFACRKFRYDPLLRVPRRQPSSGATWRAIRSMKCSSVLV